MLQSYNIIANLSQIIGAAIHRHARFRRQQFSQRRLRALNLAGKDGLTLQKRTHQNVRVRQTPAFAGQLAN
ncbi:MAG: hypothetical protein PHY43_04435 [Verrucomicrobiales bacterium]|nr:hypothetical protein [Verrucomicrobiales bacterium]